MQDLSRRGDSTEVKVISEMSSESPQHCSGPEVVLTGTGTSVGVPVVGCTCDVCLSEDPRNRRQRSGVLVRAPQGEFVIDTGPELRLQLLQNKASLIKAALFTHAHADHLVGLDDLRIFGFRMKQDIPLYCEEQVEQSVRQMFSYAFQDRSQLAHRFAAPRFRFERLSPGEEFCLLGTRVLPIRVMHGKLPILGFRIGDVAFCTDVSSIPPASRHMLHGLDTLVLGALRYAPHPTHLHVDAAVRLARQLAPRRTVLTHMAHDLDYQTLCGDLPAGIVPGYDGMTVSAGG